MAAKKPNAVQVFVPKREEIIKTAFDLIGEKGLGKTRLSAIAHRLGTELPALYARYPDIPAILADFIDLIDERMVAATGFETTSDKRDIYFDLLMTRFDALQEHRVGVLRWLNDLRKHPSLWGSTLRRWDRSLSLMLDMAQDSPLFPVKKAGLAAVYANTLRAWKEDNGEDMAKTMAALDANLGKAENFAVKYLTKPKVSTADIQSA